MDQMIVVAAIVKQVLLVLFMLIIAWKLWSDWEWVKGFFVDASGSEGKASSKRLLGIVVVSVFCYTYARVAWAKTEIMDIPLNWAMVILGVLGIAVADNYFNRKKG